MYKFVDTTEVSEVAFLPSEALKINGEYIENKIKGYRTLTVSGREALSPEIDTYETGIRDGSTLKSKRYPARIIIVKYQLIAESAEAFRSAYNQLAAVLDVEDAELIFNDETDKFFIGTPCAIGEVEAGRNAVVGEFEILCTDPFKYSVEEYEVEPTEAEDGSKVFAFDYNGTYKSFPTLEAAFYDESEANEDGVTINELTGAGDCGYVAFVNDEGKIIQLGDPDEADGEEYEASQLLVHWDFMSANKFGTAAKEKWSINSGITTASAVLQSGTPVIVKKDNGYYLSATNYGSGERWHGPSITRKIPADKSGNVGAANFTTKFSINMAIGSGTSAQKQRGGFQCLCVNGSGSSRKIVAGMYVYKGSNGNKAKMRLYVNGKFVDEREIDLSTTNIYFGNGEKSVRTCFIEKSGNKVSFNIGGVKKVFTCADEGFADLQTHEITCTFLKWGNYTPLTSHGLYYIKFTKHNCETWRDVSNKFNSADVITADCSTGEIFLNDAPTPQFGTLGNDWEEFYLQSGLNQIGVTYSDFVADEYAPTFKLRFREVFL